MRCAALFCKGVVNALTELLLEAQQTPPMAIAFRIVGVDTMMLYAINYCGHKVAAIVLSE